MWKRILALVVACGALAVTPIALAQTQGNPSPTPSTSCKPLKAVYSEKNWRERKPQHGVDVCPVQNKAGARNTVEHFYLYRHYRQIAPIRCHGGSEGYYVIPCYIIACESRFNWMAANPSGAVGVYQLLGWGAPYPARTFRDRLRNHEIAAGLSLSNWACA